MTLTSFIRKYLGEKISYWNNGDYQCVDVYRKYCDEVLGISQTPSVTGACEIFEKSGKDFEKCTESVLADYSRGDVLIWGKTSTNQYGHVAILVEIYNTKYFIVLEQDGFKQDGVKLAFRSREGLLGGLYLL